MTRQLSMADLDRAIESIEPPTHIRIGRGHPFFPWAVELENELGRWPTVEELMLRVPKEVVEAQVVALARSAREGS